MRFLILSWFVFSIGEIKHPFINVHVKLSIWNSIKQHSSENSCGFLAFPITLLTNMSASSMCECIHDVCVCVCAYYTTVNGIFQDVSGINNFTNKANTVPSAWWISFPRVSTIPLNSAPKTRPFRVLVQTFKVWAHSRYAPSWLKKRFCWSYVQTRLVSSNRRRSV